MYVGYGPAAVWACQPTGRPARVPYTSVAPDNVTMTSKHLWQGRVCLGSARWSRNPKWDEISFFFFLFPSFFFVYEKSGGVSRLYLQRVCITSVWPPARVQARTTLDARRTMQSGGFFNTRTIKRRTRPSIPSIYLLPIIIHCQTLLKQDRSIELINNLGSSRGPVRLYPLPFPPLPLPYYY